MSHVAEVTLQITDLGALRAACADLGLELHEGQTTHRWYGRFMNDWNDGERAAALRGRDPKLFGQCQHAIARGGDTGGYEIGLVPRADGKAGWDMLYDSWGPGQRLEEVAGVNLDRLRDTYAARVAQRQLARQGYRTTIKTLADGRLQVTGSK